jgi:hypothetical protein
MYGGRPLATAALIVVAAVTAAYFAVEFDRQENRVAPTTVVPETTGVPTPTITTDEFIADLAVAVVEALDLPPESEGEIVELLTDDGQPGVIVVPSPTTTTTTTAVPPPPPTTTRPRVLPTLPPISIPSADEFRDARTQQSTTIP